MLPKVKVFVWRMFHLALPVATHLIFWKVRVPLCCSQSGEESETPEHELFSCSGLIPVWHRLGVWSVLCRCVYGLMQEILLFLFDRLPHEAFELMMTTLWWLWYDRNSDLFGNKQSRLDVIPDLVNNHLEEFNEYGRRGLYLGLDPVNPVVNRATR
uniref:Reverse transcriptase zinc-binding domain-containing protein n=1 Tax=Cannabis sativa TaxID=3483 RepID=A0A803Q9L5_CANSA